MIKDLGTQRLETERLILRRFASEDAEAVYEGWTGDLRCAEQCTWKLHPNAAYTEKILSFWIDEYEDAAYNWVVELKETHQLIGNVNTVSISRANQTCEIGYCFGSRFWGCGYATEAVRCVLSFLLNECGFHLVEARHSTKNPASGRVMQKAGMEQEAVLSERQYDEAEDQYYDTVIYSAKRKYSLP